MSDNTNRRTFLQAAAAIPIAVLLPKRNPNKPTIAKRPARWEWDVSEWRYDSDFCEFRRVWLSSRTLLIAELEAFDQASPFWDFPNNSITFLGAPPFSLRVTVAEHEHIGKALYDARVKLNQSIPDPMSKPFDRCYYERRAMNFHKVFPGSHSFLQTPWTGKTWVDSVGFIFRAPDALGFRKELR